MNINFVKNTKIIKKRLDKQFLYMYNTCTKNYRQRQQVVYPQIAYANLPRRCIR